MNSKIIYKTNLKIKLKFNCLKINSSRIKFLSKGDSNKSLEAHQLIYTATHPWENSMTLQFAPCKPHVLLVNINLFISKLKQNNVNSSMLYHRVRHSLWRPTANLRRWKYNIKLKLLWRLFIIKSFIVFCLKKSSRNINSSLKWLNI